MSVNRCADVPGCLLTLYCNHHLYQWSSDESSQMMGQTMIYDDVSRIGSSIGNIFGGILQDSLGLNSMLIFVCGLTLIGMLHYVYDIEIKLV